MKYIGKCNECGKKLDKKRLYCDECSKKMANKYYRDNYYFYKQMGICTKCKRRSALENHVYCKECNDKMKQRVKEYYIKKSGVISNA